MMRYDMREQPTTLDTKKRLDNLLFHMNKNTDIT